MGILSWLVLIVTMLWSPVATPVRVLAIRPAAADLQLWSASRLGKGTVVVLEENWSGTTLAVSRQAEHTTFMRRKPPGG